MVPHSQLKQSVDSDLTTGIVKQYESTGVVETRIAAEENDEMQDLYNLYDEPNVAIVEAFAEPPEKSDSSGGGATILLMMAGVALFVAMQ